MKNTLLLALLVTSLSSFAMTTESNVEKETCISVVMDEIDATAVGDAAGLMQRNGDREAVVKLYQKVAELAMTTCKAFGE